MPVDYPATDESESERDGLLSHATEWHALILGVAAGVAGRERVLDVALGVAPPGTVAHEDVAAQPWYAAGGYLLGRLIAHVRDR